MASLRHGLRCLRDVRPATNTSQWSSSTTLAYRTKKSSSASSAARCISTDTTQSPQSGAYGDQSSPFEQAFVDYAAIEGSGSSGSNQGNQRPSVAFARAVPATPSYFSGTPIFNDAFVNVQELARKYARLPVLPREKVAPMAWKSKDQYRQAVGEHAKARDFATCMKLVKRLNTIHPDLMPQEVVDGTAPFKRSINFHLNRPKLAPIDKFGRSHGAGKRKSSIAQAWVVEGTGEVLVNGKPLSDAFGRIHDRESAVWALKSTERLDKYNVWAKVMGGGTTGQAEALTLAIAKALCVHEPALKNPLRKAGCITRDHRIVERKKHGRVKARKGQTWVKR